MKLKEFLIGFALFYAILINMLFVGIAFTSVEINIGVIIVMSGVFVNLVVLVERLYKMFRENESDKK